MRFLAIQFLIYLIFVPNSSFSRDYYVSTDGDDNASGTITHPWKTIQKACDSASPGSTVHVKSGIYYEKIALNVEGNAKEGYVTLRNYENDHVIISGEGVPNNPASYTDDIVFIENKSFIRIQGFEIKDVDAEECSGIRFIGTGSNIEFRNNTIHDIRGGGEDGGAMGITVYGTDKDVAITHLIIDGNSIYNCDPAYSETLVVNGNVAHFIISNNIVHDVNNIGIDMIGGEAWIGKSQPRNGVCRGNTVYQAHSKAGAGFAAGIYVDGAKDIIVEGNEVYECDVGIEIGAENRGIVASGITVRKNYVHDNDKVGIGFGGYRKIAGRTKNCIFTENTLKNNDTKNAGFGELWVQFAIDNQIYNNHLSPGPQNIMISSYDGEFKNSFNYDTFCPYPGSEHPPLFIWNSVAYEGLKAFQEATGQELNGRLCQEHPESK